jgi:hypothetical protein
MRNTPNQQQLKTNKKNVMTFYDLMFNQNNPAEAIKRYVGEVFTFSTIQQWLMVRRLSLSTLREWQKCILTSAFTLSGPLQNETMESCTAIRSGLVTKVTGLELTSFA